MCICCLKMSLFCLCFCNTFLILVPSYSFYCNIFYLKKLYVTHYIDFTNHYIEVACVHHKPLQIEKCFYRKFPVFVQLSQAILRSQWFPVRNVHKLAETLTIHTEKAFGIVVPSLASQTPQPGSEPGLMSYRTLSIQ